MLSSSHDVSTQFSELYAVTSSAVGHDASVDDLTHDVEVVAVADASDTSVNNLLADAYAIAASDAIVTLLAKNLNFISYIVPSAV